MYTGKAINLEWSEQYSVGIAQLDDQHKVLFSMLRQLSLAMTKAQGRQTVAALLHKFADYVLVHFNTEERLLEESGYPELESHREEHRQFIRRLLELNEKVKQGNVLVASEMQQFLLAWINDHVLVIDKAYSSHVQEYLSTEPLSLG